MGFGGVAIDDDRRRVDYRLEEVRARLAGLDERLRDAEVERNHGPVVRVVQFDRVSVDLDSTLCGAWLPELRRGRAAVAGLVEDVGGGGGYEAKLAV